MTWSAAQYVAFEDERTRPVRDLLAALPADLQVGAAVDLGCGPGNSTEVLAARYTQAAVLGLDSSPDMIVAARRRLPNVQFELGEIENWRDAGLFDLILANAVLQWVPDHQRLLPQLIGRLRVSGALAIQMPDNLDTPAHRLMRETAADGPWAEKLANVSGARTTLPAADWYYSLLSPLCSNVDIWRTTYHHPLAGGAASVTEWFKGSGLRPFLEPLDEQERASYLAKYTVGAARAYRTLPDGCVLLPFPRLFIAAIKRAH